MAATTLEHLLCVVLKKKVKVLVAQLYLTLCDPIDCKPPGSSVHGILWARILDWVSCSLLQGNLPDPGIEPGSPALQADSLLFRHCAKPSRCMISRSAKTNLGWVSSSLVHMKELRRRERLTRLKLQNHL